MPPVGFEPTISAGERPKTYAFGRAATGTGLKHEVARRIKVYSDISVDLLVPVVAWSKA